MLGVDGVVLDSGIEPEAVAVPLAMVEGRLEIFATATTAAAATPPPAPRACSAALVVVILAFVVDLGSYARSDRFRRSRD